MSNIYIFSYIYIIFIKSICYLCWVIYECASVSYLSYRAISTRVPQGFFYNPPCCFNFVNIFIDTNQFLNYTTFPLYNRLADHDDHLLKINDLNLLVHTHHTYTIRSLNNYSIEEFKTRLSCESWESVLSRNRNIDVDTLFNSFINDYLRLFYTSFSPHKIS